MDRLISPDQTTYIKYILLVDGMVVVNEIVDLTRKSKKDCLLFKIDFKKACDSMN